MRIKLPQILFTVFVIYFIVLGIKPFDRTIWISENIPVVLIVAFLVLTYKKFKFSNFSYIMMSFFLFMHTLGGHFTFERVPFDFITNLFNFERNNFDRLSHFSVGLYAFPIQEYLFKKRLVNSKAVLMLFGVFSIFTVAAVYEIIEWVYSVLSNPEASSAFLGSQGDVWDAQKDMFADGLGAFFASVIFFIKFKNQEKII